MKTLKKTVLLMLVLAVLASVLALPAVAVAEPHDHGEAADAARRTPVLQCDCGGIATYTRMEESYYVLVCSSCGRIYRLPR